MTPTGAVAVFVNAALMVGIFLLDMLTPLGVAVWSLYAAPIFLTHRSAQPGGIVVAAAVATALIFTGHFLSPAGIEPALALLNRLLGTGLLWLTTGVLMRQRQLNMSLKRERDLEAELARLARLYDALGQINQAIVRSTARDDLFRMVCRVLVERGGFHMAWIGLHDPQTQRLVSVADFGDENGYLRSIEVYADDRPLGRGPSGIAFRTGRPYICNDMLSNPVSLPWRPELVRRGLRSAAVFPVRLDDRVIGTLAVYSDDPHYFLDKETELLEEAAGNVSFALDNFDKIEAGRRAERKLRSEKQFSDTMIESMPGILYFYDVRGRFLRWNRNFETVSGRSAEEIAGMRPLDFFRDEDRAGVEQQIAEVFARGESSVEAPFVSKDGSVTPYFFTGRLVPYEGESCLVGVGIDISDRRSAEDRLVESERKYRELVEHANSIILRWNAEGEITFLNEFGQRFFGYGHDEILGRHVMDTIVPSTETGGRDLRRLVEEIGADPESFEQSVNENMRRDGGRVWVAWTNRIERDDAGRLIGILSVGTDITERKRAEAKLKESEALYRTLFEYAPDGILRSDLEGNYLDANASICRMFGYTREEFVRLHARDIIVESETPEIEPALRSIERKVDHHREWRFRRKDGSVFPAEVIATMMPDGNILGMIRDITERKEAEAERVKRHQAEAADRIKSAFLATMSHELRTPLNSIIGFTGILLQGLAGPLNAEQKKQLEMVRTSARHLLALVNDVLDISKIEAGQLDVACERFDPARSIVNVLETVAPAAAKKSISLRREIGPGLAEAVGDQRRFEQILLNLLSNAIKFTDRGEVTLTAESVEADGRAAIRVTVTDTGIGIDAADLANLFQPFKQIDSGLSRNHDGTGLGLAICRRLADLMGGTIEARSAAGRGSTFTVTLPTKGSPKS